jgi:hypothetical protein
MKDLGRYTTKDGRVRIGLRLHSRTVALSYDPISGRTVAGGVLRERPIRISARIDAAASQAAAGRVVSAFATSHLD